VYTESSKAKITTGIEEGKTRGGKKTNNRRRRKAKAGTKPWAVRGIKS
jgi:hypothetical protein